MKTCKICNKILTNKVNIFCSRSCSAKHSNKSENRPKSTNRKPCARCGQEIRNKRTVHCILCRSIYLHEQTGAMKKSQVGRERLSAHARRVLKQASASCLVCGYNFAVEVAHIRAVKSFSEDTLINEINKEDNLIPLCPNHHIEFDRGKLSLKQILGSVA